MILLVYYTLSSDIAHISNKLDLLFSGYLPQSPSLSVINRCLCPTLVFIRNQHKVHILQSKTTTYIIENTLN